MFDRQLRGLSANGFEAAARRVPVAVSPTAITGVALGLGVGAAAAAAAGVGALAVGLWLANRFVDGLDGAVARLRTRATDQGGYLDIVGDTLVYALIPLGVAVGVDDRSTWIATAVLLASFYVNSITWAYLSALLERRSAGAQANGEVTSVTMPVGLVEGAETVVWFTLLLAVASLAPWWMGTMAAATLAGALLRVRAGFRVLRPR